MNIFDEGVLDKGLEGPRKNLDEITPGRQFWRSLMMNNSNNRLLIFQGSFH